MIKIPAKLKFHPKTSRHAKKFLQAEGSAWSYASSLVNNLIDPLVGDMDGFG
jgi:hypothetical protein